MQNMHHHSSLPDYVDGANESVISSRTLPDQFREVLETMSPQSGKRPIFFAAHDKFSQNESIIQSAEPSRVIRKCQYTSLAIVRPLVYPGRSRQNRQMVIMCQKLKAEDGRLESLLPGKSWITNEFFLECPRRRYINSLLRSSCRHLKPFPSENKRKA
jgi:hypothetical protein